jgi:molecular chaperone IbpA
MPLGRGNPHRSFEGAEKLPRRQIIMTLRDFHPIFRQSIGFDTILDNLEAVISSPGYPPYNIERVSDDSYKLTLAIAGFAQDEIEIIAEAELLTVKGTKKGESKTREFLHQGIAGRNFVQRISLEAHIVVGAATIENGLLNIDLKRVVPEALKPRTITVNQA